MQRRKFLESVGAGVFGVAFGARVSMGESEAGKSAGALPILGRIDPQDERFWSIVRDQFPLTRSRAYFNTGGLGASPYCVIDAVKRKTDELELMSETGQSEELWKKIKDKASRVFGASPSELAFTRNTTEGMNIIACGLPLKRGDEVILTTHEHVGGTLCWLNRQKRDRIVVKAFEPDTTSSEGNLERIESLITKRTRVISVSHVTCTTGQVLPVKEICTLAHGKGLWVVLDGAQAVGMCPTDVRDYGCDAYSTSGHKWLLGPKGTGLLYVRENMLDVIEPIMVGAYSDNGFDLLKGNMSYHPTAQRYEYGTVSSPLMVGVGSAIDFLESIGLQNTWNRNRALSTCLVDGLSEMKGVDVLTPMRDSERGAMVSFKLRNVEISKLQSFLAEKCKLRTRGVGEANLNALRISTHIYNNFEEVGRVVEGVKAATNL